MAAIRVPLDLLRDVDRRVGTRQRSRFFIEAVRRELKRLEQLEALEASAGAWKSADYADVPETVDGLRTWLKAKRAEASRIR